MKNFNKKQTLMTLGRTALLAMSMFLASTVYAADPWAGDIANEALTRGLADAELDNRIDDTNRELGAEVTRSTNEDTRLNNRLDNEALTRGLADAELDNRIDDTNRELGAEVVRSTNEDTRLNNAIGDRNISSRNQQIDTATRQDSLSAGLKAAGDAIGNMAFTGTHYVASDRDLSSAVRTLDANLNRVENHFNGEINRLENKLDKHHHEMKRGFASLAAMTRLVPNPRGCGDTQIAVGVGHYQGSTGVAIGMFHYIDNNTLVNVGVGYSGHDSATFGAGLTFGF